MEKRPKWMRNVSPRFIFRHAEYRNMVSSVFIINDKRLMITCQYNDSAVLWNLLQFPPVFKFRPLDGCRNITKILTIYDNSIIGLSRLKSKCLGLTNVLCASLKLIVYSHIFYIVYFHSCYFFSFFGL